MSSGYKSALWFERLSANVQRKAGYKSFLAFWMGGASAKISIIPPTPPVSVQVVEQRRWPGPSYVIYRDGETDYEWRRRQRREEEEIILL